MLITIIFVILIAVLCGGVFVSLNNSIPTDGFVVVYNEERIMEDTGGLYFQGTTTLEVQQYLNGTETVDVKIYAVGNEENDFTFIMDGVTYKWSQTLAGKDITPYLLSNVVQPTKEGGNALITVAGGVYQVLENYAEDNFGFKVIEILPNNVPSGDIFKMVITVGESSRTITFNKGSEVTGVKLPGHIIF